MAASGAVGAAEVAWFPGFVQRAEGVGNVLGELVAGGVNGLGGREAFEAVRWISNDWSHRSYADARLSADDHQPKDVSKAKMNPVLLFDRTLEFGHSSDPA